MTDTEVTIYNDANNDSKHEFIRPGHYIKISNEIMWVSAVNVSGTDTILTVEREQLGTSKASGTWAEYVANNDILMISPRLKITNNKRGKKIKIIAKNQRGYIDSFGVVFKTKSIK